MKTRAVMITRVFAAAALGLGGCSAELTVPSGADIRCATARDCPADFACIDERCLSAAHECVIDTADGLGAAVDGTPCRETPGGICVRGLCLTRGCGDGFIEDGEACDFGADNSDDTPDRCRTDCSLPRCGDAVVDSAESCDDTGAECVACAQLCALGRADCDDSPGCECTPRAIFDTEGTFISQMVIDDDAFFLVASSGAADLQIALLRVTRDGSHADVLKAPVDDFGPLLVDDTYVYFCDPAARLARMPKAGGDEEQVANAIHAAVDGAFLYTFDDAEGVARLDRATLRSEVLVPGPITGLRSGTSVAGQVFTATDLGVVARVDGGTLVTVAEHQFDEGTAVELVTDGVDLYWLDDRSQVIRLPLVHGVPSGSAFAISTPPDLQRGARTANLHVDAAGLVYSAELLTDHFDGPGGIMELAGGTAPRMRARDGDQIHAVTADSRDLCWPADFSVVTCISR